MKWADLFPGIEADQGEPKHPLDRLFWLKGQTRDPGQRYHLIDFNLNQITCRICEDNQWIWDGEEDCFRCDHPRKMFFYSLVPMDTTGRVQGDQIYEILPVKKGVG